MILYCSVIPLLHDKSDNDDCAGDDDYTDKRLSKYNKNNNFKSFKRILSSICDISARCCYFCLYGWQMCTTYIPEPFQINGFTFQFL